MAAKSDRIVIKVGTSTLTNELGNSNLRTMEKLAMVLSDIQNMGHEVILVSSGAIASFFCVKISPVSRPASICMIVTPVSESPLSNAHWIGAAPR